MVEMVSGGDGDGGDGEWWQIMGLSIDYNILLYTIHHTSYNSVYMFWGMACILLCAFVFAMFCGGGDI